MSIATGVPACKLCRRSFTLRAQFVVPRVFTPNAPVWVVFRATNRDVFFVSEEVAPSTVGGFRARDLIEVFHVFDVELVDAGAH